MLLVVLEMVCRNAEHPCGKGAVPFKGGEVGHYFQQNVLGRILSVVERAQHPQRQVEYQILHTGQHRLQRGLIPGGGLLDQNRQFLIFFRVHKNTSYRIRLA